MAAALCWSSTSVAQQSATIANYGGAAGEAFSKTIWQPLAKEMGIRIKEDSLNGIGDIRSQVTANSVQWDVVEISVDECAEGEAEGLFLPINREKLISMGYDSESVKKSYVLTNTASYMIAYNKTKYGNNGPKTWADFWDTKKFPGSRALRNGPSSNLEAALFADGVSIDSIYPIDINRAFSKLKEIKPNIRIWWSSGAQAAQLVRDSEVDMIGIWNSRFESVVNAGAPYTSTFNQGILIC
jgi:putative spermidine/putrescine transport system substrate-binding protein